MAGHNYLCQFQRICVLIIWTFLEKQLTLPASKHYKEYKNAAALEYLDVADNNLHELLDEEHQNKKLESRITSKVDEHFKDGVAQIISHVRS